MLFEAEGQHRPCEAATDDCDLMHDLVWRFKVPTVDDRLVSLKIQNS